MSTQFAQRAAVVLATGLALLTSGITPARVSTQSSGTFYRVNAGGPALSGAPNWTADTASAPSIYTNAGLAGSSTFSMGAAINLTDASVPTDTPAALFQSERWDPSGGGGNAMELSGHGG